MSSPISPLTSLPPEILSHIFKFLKETITLTQLFSLRRTCIIFNSIINSLPVTVLKHSKCYIGAIIENNVPSFRKSPPLKKEYVTVELQAELIARNRKTLLRSIDSTNLCGDKLALFAEIIGHRQSINELNLYFNFSNYTNTIGHVMSQLPLTYATGYDNSSRKLFKYGIRSNSYFLCSELSSRVRQSNGLTSDVIYTLVILKVLSICFSNKEECGKMLYDTKNLPESLTVSSTSGEYRLFTVKKKEYRKYRKDLYKDLLIFLILYGLSIDAPPIYYYNIFNGKRYTLSHILINRGQIDLLIKVRQLHKLADLDERDIAHIIALHGGCMSKLYSLPLTEEYKIRLRDILHKYLSNHSYNFHKRKVFIIHETIRYGNDELLGDIIQWVNGQLLLKDMLELTYSTSQSLLDRQYRRLINWMNWRCITLLDFIMPPQLRQKVYNPFCKIGVMLDCPGMAECFPQLNMGFQNRCYNTVCNWLQQIIDYITLQSNNNRIYYKLLIACMWWYKGLSAEHKPAFCNWICTIWNGQHWSTYVQIETLIKDECPHLMDTFKKIKSGL